MWYHSSEWGGGGGSDCYSSFLEIVLYLFFVVVVWAWCGRWKVGGGVRSMGINSHFLLLFSSLFFWWRQSTRKWLRLQYLLIYTLWYISYIITAPAVLGLASLHLANILGRIFASGITLFLSPPSLSHWHSSLSASVIILYLSILFIPPSSLRCNKGIIFHFYQSIRL